MEDNKYIDNIEYQYLNPIDNLDSNEVNDLKKILTKENIKNIAVTGPYSSGKSSVVNSALNKINNDKKCLFNKKINSITISLAKLMNDNETQEIISENSEINNEDQENISKEIESDNKTQENNSNKNENNTDIKQDKIDIVKISSSKNTSNYNNQGKVNNNTLRRTIVEKIYYSCVKNENRFNIVIGLFAAWIAIVLFLAFWLYKYNMFDYWHDNYEKSFMWLKIILVIIICITLAAIIFMLIKITKHASLSYGDINLDLSFDSLDNPFITKLQAIIKILKRKKIKYIIFEDLDRFNCYSIFDDLRDLNDNLNKRIKITFIYEVRDDIFTPESKGKFFDIAIPVVPFLSFESSGEELNKFFKSKKMALSDKFINNVSVYINDIRILKNAYNSYCIYYNNLDKSIESNDSLFTYMLYKELFPDDFYKFINHEGVIIDIIEKFKRKINEVSVLNSESIKIFIDNYGQYTKECMSSVTELNNENPKYIEFIKFAIINGYIDTDYSNYIYRFNKGSRTREDNDFVVKVRSLNNIDNFDYKIKDVPSVVKVLVDTDYAKYSSLNINILKELLLLNKDEQKKYIKTLINSSYYIRALEEYHTNETGYLLFIEQLVQWDNNIFNTILKTKQKDNIIKFIINNVNLVFISNNLSVKELICYLESNNIINSLILERYRILKELKLKINNLEIISEKELRDYLVNNELYKINFNNIVNILKNNKSKIDFIKKKNMTEIMKNKKLKKYVLNNFEEYLNDCYSQFNNQSDTQDIICEIINNASISEENIIKFMEKQNDIIENIELIKDEMIEFCLKNGYLEYSLNNIITCLNNGIDESIVYSCINENKITIKRGDNKYVETIKKILNNNLLDINSANDLLKVKFKKSDKYQYDEIISINNKEIVKAIVKSNNVSFDNNILNYIISNDYNLDDYIVNNKEVIERDFEKIKQYFNLKAKTIMINSKNKNEFIFGDEIRCKVVDLATEAEIDTLKIDTLKNIFNLQIENHFAIKFKLFEKLFDSLNDENRVKLINNNIDYLLREQLIDIIDAMNDENYRKMLTNGKIAKINNTEDNLLLIKNLKKKNFNIKISKIKDEVIILKRNTDKV